MIIIDANLCYHNLKPDRKSSYLTTFAHLFSRYCFPRLSIRVAPTGDMFKGKIEETFKGPPNVFGIVDDILIVWYDADGRDHNRKLKQVRQICN